MKTTKKITLIIMSVLLKEEKNNQIWLFVEILKSNLDTDFCKNPISYGYKNQTLRAWVNGANTVIL